MPTVDNAVDWLRDKYRQGVRGLGDIVTQETPNYQYMPSGAQHALRGLVGMGLGMYGLPDPGEKPAPGMPYMSTLPGKPAVRETGWLTNEGQVIRPRGIYDSHDKMALNYGLTEDEHSPIGSAIRAGHVRTTSGLQGPGSMYFHAMNTPETRELIADAINRSPNITRVGFDFYGEPESGAPKIEYDDVFSPQAAIKMLRSKEPPSEVAKWHLLGE